MTDCPFPELLSTLPDVGYVLVELGKMGIAMDKARNVLGLTERMSHTMRLLC